MNANIYGRSQIFETEKRKSRKKIRNKNACRVACIWTYRRYAVGCSGRCTEHDVTVRGFVEQKYLDFSDETKKQIEANGEDKYQTAKETVKPEENQALYYTLTSVKEGSPSGEIRLGAQILCIQCTTLPFMGFYAISSMYMQNIGQYSRALWISIARQGFFYIPLLFLLPVIGGQLGLFWVQPAADFLSVIFAGVILWRYHLYTKKSNSS